MYLWNINEMSGVYMMFSWAKGPIPPKCGPCVKRQQTQWLNLCKKGREQTRSKSLQASQKGTWQKTGGIPVIGAPPSSQGLLGVSSLRFPKTCKPIFFVDTSSFSPLCLGSGPRETRSNRMQGIFCPSVCQFVRPLVYVYPTFRCGGQSWAAERIGPWGQFPEANFPRAWLAY